MKEMRKGDMKSRMKEVRKNRLREQNKGWKLDGKM